ncbi:polysaccharide biosynthesis protein [Enterobacter hormaechei]|nr:polysaccharide biosynthesis protein [Enterobacter hormaechei]
MAPLVHALARDPDIEAKVCVTAQHREMLDQVLTLFSIVPDYDLNIMKPGQGLTEITCRILQELKPILESFKPDVVLVPALVVIPAAFMLMRRGNVPLNYLKPQWDKMLAGQLGKFTLMALITSVTLPVAYVMMRNLLAAHYSWDEVGIWQGVSSISDAYLQFITASFSVYLLPTLSRLTSRQDITREIFRSLRFVLPAVAIASFTVWLLRDFAIWLLFSAKFTAMRDLFAWQLVGDVLKVGAYVFGYLVIAKASLRLYILAEIGQFALLTAFSHWLIPTHGALGAAQAYMATYIVYFAACCGVFLLWRKRA